MFEQISTYVFVAAGVLVYLLVTAVLYKYKYSMAESYYESNGKLSISKEILFSFFFPLSYVDEDNVPFCICADKNHEHGFYALLAPPSIVYSVFIWAFIGVLTFFVAFLDLFGTTLNLKKE